jgi:formylglycine-generating enzyme required for sulfatase activity
MADDDLDSDTTSKGDDLEFGRTIRGFGKAQKVLGRFVLERRLGRGGMGVVWLAKDEALGDLVALKFVTEEVKNDAGAVDDLKNETRKARHLTHPNIVRIHEFWEDSATAAVSMEFVDGPNLSQRRLEQPQKVFSVEMLKPWVKQLCEALDYAHGKVKLVHRDIKPSNLMIDGDGDMKVADFGISAAISETTTRVSKLMSSGFTEAYSSPQQLRGRPPVAADDIYSLGATLYELLTGKPPFFRGNLILQVKEEIAPSMSDRRKEFGLEGLEAIPTAWEATVAACLAKEPGDRPQTAVEVWARLNRAGKDETERQRVSDDLGGPEGSEAEGSGVFKAEEEAEILSQKLTGLRKKKRWVWWCWGAISVLALAIALVGFFLWVENELAKQQSEVRQERNEAVREDRARLKREQEAWVGEVKARFLELSEQFPKPETGQRWLVPGVWIELVPIPEGTFTMGSPITESGHGVSEVQHLVTLTKPYWLGATEVTLAQWELVMGSLPIDYFSEYLEEAEVWNEPKVKVSWRGVEGFCQKLTKRERALGRLPEGYEYRLPTEAQWEYACRAGTTGAYAGDLHQLGWTKENSGSKMHVVAQKQANAWGLYDMHGNIYEMCSDWYGYYPRGSAKDPMSGPSQSDDHRRVVRGGSWARPADSARSAARAGVSNLSSDESTLGFRLALSAVR